MSGFYEDIGHIILMLLLLGCSAFFSGSETAFFNLSRRQITLLKKSGHRLQKLAAKITGEPRQLLSCLLFGNMTVNVLFYAVSSVLVIKVEEQIGITAAASTAFLCFAVLVFFGEILPKSLAYSNSRAVSMAAAMPVFLCIKLLSPIVLVFRILIVEPALRLILGPIKRCKAITVAEFKALVEQVRKRGLITPDESQLLTEIIEFGFLKVHDCLRPRVDMIACNVRDSSEYMRSIMVKNNLTKLPVYVDTIDNIVGMVYLRQLLLQPETSCEELVQQAHFVPEQKTIESLLEFFRKTRTDTAIVVDEYGGIAGSISLEDIAEELLGPIEATGQIEPIKQIGPFEYRLAGDLAIHDWSKFFGIDPAETRISTLSGLVCTLLGRIPKSGDVAHLRNLKFTVEQVQKHRIKSIILTMESIETQDD